MIIEPITDAPNCMRGRPPLYPFDKLEPGNKLTIDDFPDGIDKHHNRVKSALYQYKKTNSLTWETAVRIENDKIVIYRVA